METCAPFQKFTVIWGDGETSLGHLSLVHANAPKIEMVHVRVNVGLTKTFVLIVVADMVVSSRSAREYERERGKQVRREDCIAEEGGWD